MYDTDALRKAATRLDNANRAYALISHPDHAYGPWGPSKSDGSPTNKPEFKWVTTDLTDDEAKTLAPYLNAALRDYLGRIVADARQMIVNEQSGAKAMIDREVPKSKRDGE